MFDAEKMLTEVEKFEKVLFLFIFMEISHVNIK